MNYSSNKLIGKQLWYHGNEPNYWRAELFIIISVSPICALVINSNSKKTSIAHHSCINISDLTQILKIHVNMPHKNQIQVPTNSIHKEEQVWISNEQVWCPRRWVILLGVEMNKIQMLKKCPLALQGWATLLEAQKCMQECTRYLLGLDIPL